jgi:cell division protein FtsZ
MVQLNRQYDRENNSGEPIHVKVVGVGGAGSNILDRVMLDGIEAADLVAINTDVQSLTASVAAHKVQLGRNLTRGLGSGGDPELGYAAGEEATDEIRSVLQGGTVIFLCTGLGHWSRKLLRRKMPWCWRLSLSLSALRGAGDARKQRKV